MIQITKPRCEYQTNPLGIDRKEPRFFWQISSDEPDVLQTGYQIQVSTRSDFSDRVWDTLRIESGQGIQIPYAGPALQPKTRYFWRVRVWVQSGQKADFTTGSWFETGLMDSDNWQASWMAPKQSASGQLGCPLIHGECILKDNILSARAYVTAAGVYELRVNGKSVGDNVLAPGWTTYQKRHQYQTYDLTQYLQPGENALGAILAPGWYLSELGWEKGNHYYGDELALLFQAEITYADGSVQVVCADDSWIATQNGPWLESEIYHGESYDATREITGWDLAGFEGNQWEALHPIELGYDQLIAQESLDIGRIEEIHPREIIVTPSGQTVLDMGQNMVGHLRFEVSGNAGDVVEIIHFEVLDHEGNVYLDNLRNAKQTVRYTLKGDGRESFEPSFTFMGFRYAYLQKYPGPVNLNDFTGVVIHTRLENTGTFECSDPLINQLQHNILWSQKGNFLDVPTDCPQRDERLGWTGDAQVFIRTACFNMNVAPFFEKWLHDFSADQRSDGALPLLTPNVLDWHARFPNDGLIEDEALENHTSSVWADAIIICPWALYLCYGDVAILQDLYPSMQRYIEYVLRQGANPYLWNTGFHMGDWLGLDSKEGTYVGATDIHLIATAFYAKSTELLSKIAGILERPADAARYRELHQHIRSNFQQAFISQDGCPQPLTQTACVLALAFDLLEDEQQKRTCEALESLLHENNDHLTTGFVGTPYLPHVLSQFGLNDLAYTLLLNKDYPSWLNQVEKGATTIWEHWDGIKEDGSFWSPDMNSFNHYAYGSIGDWMVRVICGLNIDEKEPGYKHIRISPKPGGELDWAKASYESLYGKILSKWRISNGKTRFEFIIPANTTATLQIEVQPDCDFEIICGQPQDILLEATSCIICVGSGYHVYDVITRG